MRAKDKISKFILGPEVMGKKYYLYLHIREDTEEIFYVGIGTLDKSNKYARAKSLSGRNCIWKRIVNKTKYKVLVIDENEDEEPIINKEIYYISLLGKMKEKSGHLCNISDGGRGNLSIRSLMSKEAEEKMIKSRYKPIIQYDLEGNFIKEWDCAKNALLSLGISKTGGITDALRGKNKTFRGFIWSYKGVEPKKYVPNISAKQTRVDYYLKGNFIKTFEFVRHASKELGLIEPYIYQLIRTGFTNRKGISFKRHETK